MERKNSIHPKVMIPPKLEIMWVVFSLFYHVPYYLLDDNRQIFP